MREGYNPFTYNIHAPDEAHGGYIDEKKTSEPTPTQPEVPLNSVRAQKVPGTQFSQRRETRAKAKRSKQHSS